MQRIFMTQKGAGTSIASPSLLGGSLQVKTRPLEASLFELHIKRQG